MTKVYANVPMDVGGMFLMMYIIWWENMKVVGFFYTTKPSTMASEVHLMTQKTSIEDLYDSKMETLLPC